MPPKDKDKGKSKDGTPGPRPNTRSSNPGLMIPEEQQDIKNAAEGRKFLKKHSLLCPLGEPATNGLLAGCLYQIAAMAGVPKQSVNAIRATAFLLEELEEHAISQMVRDAFDSQITEFSLDMKQLIEDVNSKIDSHLKEAVDQLVKATTGATLVIGAANRLTPPPPVTNTLAIFNPPPHRECQGFCLKKWLCIAFQFC